MYLKVHRLKEISVPRCVHNVVPLSGYDMSPLYPVQHDAISDVRISVYLSLGSVACPGALE